VVGIVVYAQGGIRVESVDRAVLPELRPDPVWPLSNEDAQSREDYQRFKRRKEGEVEA